MVYFQVQSLEIHTSTLNAYSWVKLLHAHVFESGDTDADCYAAYPIRIWALKEKALFDGLSQLSFAFLGYGVSENFREPARTCEFRFGLFKKKKLSSSDPHPEPLF